FKDFGLIIFIAFASSIYAYSVLIKVMKKISPFTVVLVSNLTPVYGMVAALVIYGTSEMMTTYFYAGTLIILASVVAYPVMDWAGKQRQKVLAQKV
ncbi:MAG: EamA family transporter, partial [Thermoflexibacteraceae bacterium]